VRQSRLKLRGDHERWDSDNNKIVFASKIIPFVVLKAISSLFLNSRIEQNSFIMAIYIMPPSFCLEKWKLKIMILHIPKVSKIFKNRMRLRTSSHDIHYENIHYNWLNAHHELRVSYQSENCIQNISKSNCMIWSKNY
jgi:hypothetical protein